MSFCKRLVSRGDYLNDTQKKLIHTYGRARARAFSFNSTFVTWKTRFVIDFFFGFLLASRRRYLHKRSQEEHRRLFEGLLLGKHPSIYLEARFRSLHPPLLPTRIDPPATSSSFSGNEYNPPSLEERCQDLEECQSHPVVFSFQLLAFEAFHTAELVCVALSSRMKIIYVLFVNWLKKRAQY